jgi:hypothetical protein
MGIFSLLVVVEVFYKAVKRELKKAMREYENAELIRTKSHSQLSELLSEAYEVGIIEKEIIVQNNQDYSKILHCIVNWKPTKNFDDSIHDDQLENLLQKIAELKKKVKETSEEIEQAKIFAEESSGYSSEVSEQVLRLNSIYLFDPAGCKEDICPLCSNKLNNPTPNIQMIKASLTRLKSRLESANREKTKLRKYIEKKEGQKRQLLDSLDDTVSIVNGIYTEKDANNTYRDLNIRRGIVIGRIKSYLESVQIVDEDIDIKKRIAEYSEKEKKLEEQVDSQTVEDSLQIALNSINYDMTEYARKLKLEHSKNHIMFDYKRVTVVVDRYDKPISLIQMGSATNFLGYHLVTLFALHKYFRNHNRPVPSFLFIDQMSQVSYSSNVVEKEIMKQMFEFIFNFENELSTDFQIVLTEHAEFDETWYQNAIVTRLDEGLIPNDWIERES